MADHLYYFADDEESEWLANIDPSLLGKSNEEKQLDDSENSNFRQKLTLMFGVAGETEFHKWEKANG